MWGHGCICTAKQNVHGLTSYVKRMRVEFQLWTTRQCIGLLLTQQYNKCVNRDLQKWISFSKLNFAISAHIGCSSFMNFETSDLQVHSIQGSAEYKRQLLVTAFRLLNFLFYNFEFFIHSSIYFACHLLSKLRMSTLLINKHVSAYTNQWQPWTTMAFLAAKSFGA